MFSTLHLPNGKFPGIKHHKYGVISEWYFDFGQKAYSVCEENSKNSGDFDGVITVKPDDRKKGALRTAFKVFICALKVLSWFTLVIPLTMLILKCIYRSENIFWVNSSGKSNPFIKKPKLLSPEDAAFYHSFMEKVASINNLSLERLGLEIDDNRAQDVKSRYQRELIQAYDIRLRRRVAELEHLQKVVEALYSESKLQEKGLEFNDEVDSLVFDSANDFVKIDYLLKKILLMKSSITSLIQKFAGADEELTGRLSRFNDELVEIREKFNAKISDNEDFNKYLLELQNEVRECGNIQELPDGSSLLENYVVAVNICINCSGEEFSFENAQIDQDLYSRIIGFLKPNGIKNWGNSCYLNSMLQSILNVPQLSHLLEEQEWSSERSLANCNQESDPSEILRLNRHVEVKGSIKSVVDSYKTGEAAAINNAARNLRGKLYDAGYLHGPLTSQQDAEEVLTQLLSQVGYGFPTRSYKKYGFGDDERVRVHPEENTQAIQVSLKDESGGDAFSFSFQGLIDNYFVEQEYFDEDHVWEHDNGVREECPFRREGVEFLEAPEYLFVTLKRFSFNNQFAQAQKISEDFAFDNGEAIDFSAAMSEELKSHSDGRPFLYEPVAVIQHQGESANGGHYTADIKKGGQWYRCNDNVVGNPQSINSRLGSGYVYLFKKR
ncbi:MAG: hypothetical protein VX777_10135 [Chlamydiota bacterium]|nr:hypothetical protein [Chlamydiota bacterium]